MWLTAFVVVVHCAIGMWLYYSQQQDEIRKEKKWRERYEWRD
jgi:hypothetical protein